MQISNHKLSALAIAGLVVGLPLFARAPRTTPTPASAAGCTIYCPGSTSIIGCVPTISCVGTPSASAASGFALDVNNVDGMRNGTIRYNTVQGTLTGPNSDGNYRCLPTLSPPTGINNSGAIAGQCNGSLHVDFAGWMSSHPAALGNPMFVGQTFYAQGFFSSSGTLKTSPAVTWIMEP